MEHNDREYTDMLNNELKDIEPGAGLHSKVRDGIARNVVHMRRRNTTLGAVVIAVILTMGLSAVTPVFGRNGTLPQVITAMAAERQAKKISKTLGTASVQQTDGVLALVIANKSGTPEADVLKLRATGLGWGRIMAQLNVSGRDIGKAMSQVKAAAKTKGQGENPKPAVTNTDGTNIVVSGEITGVSATIITVDGKSFVIGSTTQIKYQGKAITTTEIAAKLLTGKFYATVQGTKQVNTINTTTLLANLIIVQDTAEQANPSNEQANPSNEQAAVSNDQQARGKVTVVSVTVLHIDGFANDIILNADTKVEQVGAGTTNIAAIKLGQTVQVHVILSGTTYTAQQVHIEDAYVKTDTTNSAVTTWQGTIASITPGAQFITLTEFNNPTVFFRIMATSVLQDASHKALLFTTLTAGQKVTIMGRTLTDNSVEVVKLTTTTSTSVNPGKGKGKH